MKKVLISTVFLLFVGIAFGQNTSPKTYLIKAGKLYDSENNVFLNNQQILVEGNKIVKVAQNIPVGKEVEIIDMPNFTVCPGLIDAHTHILTLQGLNENLVIDAVLKSGETRVLRGAGQARTFLNAGFTTIRDLGNSGQYLDVELKRAINNGYVEGPRMYVSGPILSAIDGQFYQLPIETQHKITQGEYRVIKGAEDARQAVKEHVNNSVDVIKIVAWGERLGLEQDEMKAIVETAHANRLKVTAHANTDWAIRGAINAGVDGIEHAYSLEDSTLELMKSKGIYMVPTDPSISVYLKVYELQNMKNKSVDDIKKELEPLHSRVMRAFNKGVMIVAGSDAYVDFKMPQGEVAKEFISSYFDAGLKPNDVLRTATYNASIALGKKGQIGVLKEKANADIAIFNGDIEKDFRKSLFDVKMVIKDGKVVYSK